MIFCDYGPRTELEMVGILGMESNSKLQQNWFTGSVWANFIKLFTSVIYECFVTGKSFQPNLMFVGFRVLLGNIRLGWKSLPGTNSIAFCEYL
jgi:hypothetical protein